jgi:hypothetical protein
MNINELDSYNLGDAVKFNDQLNPRIWGADEKMLPKVREQLLQIADDFGEFLGIDVEVKDITVSGSNAAYTYTPYSDIDLHLVVDLPQADANEVYRELFDAKKYAYNDQHDITIGGYDVELYVQDANKPHISQGIYSIKNNDWVNVPNRRKPNIDDISVKSKFEDIGQRIESAIESGDYEKMTELATKIRDYRQSGLDAHGEFGPENLAFKILRSQGMIQSLYDARNAAKDAMLSLDERKKKKKKKVRYGYGGYWYPGTAYAGQDHPAGTEGGGGGDGGGESRKGIAEVSSTPDGVNPSTTMILSDVDRMPADEDILQDFIDFVIKELKIKRRPRVKLRKDPQWPAVHKTFGRYQDEIETLEVAWGQRHIMDVLRTVAHELTHKHQHEREGERMGPDAGETGSSYENEANARAGVLMRDYGRLHPEYFTAGQTHDLEEGWKERAGAVAAAACIAGTPGCSTTGQVIKTTQDVGRTAQTAKNITRAGVNAELGQELRNFIRAQGGDPGSQNLSTLYQLQKRMIKKPDATNESASGYIPTKAQAKDPRFSMALTVDIKPGQVGKEANKLKLQTDKQGHPQIARADGLFEELMLEFQLAKEGIDAPISKTKDQEQYYKFILAKHKMGRPLTRGEQDFVKMYQMYRQQKLAEFAPGSDRDNNDFDSDLFEIGNNPEPHQPNSRRKNSLFHAEVDGQWVDVFFDRSELNDTLHITFTVNQNHEPPDRGSNSASKSTFRILSTVRDVIKQKLPIYMKKGRRPPSVSITSKGDSRTSLYRRYFVPVIQDILGPDWQMAEYPAGGMTVFNWKPIKKLDENVELDEVKMSPSALQQWAKSPAAQGIRAGFEAELIFRDTTNDDDDEGDMEPDYDYDERARSVSQVIDFFNGGDYGGLSDRQEGRLQDGLDEQYMEWMDERMRDAFDEEAEDLIRKVLFDEGDWDEDNEIQKQLALLDLTDDEINDIVNAGERAPKFTTSKEQTAYAEANPLYQKYLDAQIEAEGLLDDLVADEVRKKGANWDAALDDFRENFYVDDDSDFFENVGLTYMSDIAAEYSLDWPYLTGSGGGNNGGSREWDEIGSSLEKTVGMPVKVSSGYHNATRKEGQWIVEPDTSLRPDDGEDFGLEIVSPPMPLSQALEQLQAVTDWANSPYGSAYTNDSTGLHMGVSVPYKGGDVDYLKLILFLGDEYVLQSFGREANSYTKSAMQKFRENIRGGRADPAGAMALMKSNLIEFAYREIQKGVGTGKYTSAHIQDGYIEFRSAGGDWLAEGDAEPGKLENTMLRYARAMQIAADPSAERREFAKKLYKLVAPEGDSQLALFSQFAAGEIDKEQLKKRWAEKTIGTERKMNQRWKLYNRATGEPVAGQEYNGYTEEEARARAKGKLSPGSSDRDFDSAYELRNIGQDQQWEIYSVDTGETLEIVQAKNRGLAADAVFDKYANQGIGFNVRPYQDPATMTPRAKLAKRITGQPRKPVDYNYEIVNQADVRLPVVDKFYATNDTDAQKVYSQWLKNKDLPDDTADYGYRKTAAKSAEEPPWVAQNFDSARDSATLQTNLQGRAGQDATEVRRNWEFVNRINGQVIHSMTNASYNQANLVQTNLEQQNPTADIYLRSVERPN